MNIELLVKLHNDLLKLDPNQLTIVQYNEENGLIYRQMNRIVAIPYIGHLFFPKPKLKLGILTQQGYHELMQSLEKVIQDPDLKNNKLSQIIKNYAVDIYKTYDNIKLSGPQLFVSIEFVSITSSLLARWVLRTHSPETKTMLKAIQNETNKNKSRK